MGGAVWCLLGVIVGLAAFPAVGSEGEEDVHRVKREAFEAVAAKNKRRLEAARAASVGEAVCSDQAGEGDAVRGRACTEEPEVERPADPSSKR
jgi:hypothetical protein